MPVISSAAWRAHTAFVGALRAGPRHGGLMMNRKTAGLKRLVIIGFVALGTAVMNAQQPAAPTPRAERSWAVQNMLQSIEADREAWVSNLVSKWASVLDPTVYDLASELAPRARVAPAWQLYGASLAGDFRTMMQVLRGTRAAGDLINGLSTPAGPV